MKKYIEQIKKDLLEAAESCSTTVEQKKEIYDWMLQQYLNYLHEQIKNFKAEKS